MIRRPRCRQAIEIDGKNLGRSDLLSVQMRICITMFRVDQHAVF
jgi:hypothetical protein